MTTSTTTKPHQLQKIGRVRAKVWHKVQENGGHDFDVELFRTYKLTDQDQLKGPDDNGFRDVTSLKKGDLLNARHQIDRALQLIEALENE